MVRLRRLTSRQAQQALQDGYDVLGRVETAVNVGITVYNIATGTPGEPSPLPIANPVQPFPNIPFYMDDPNIPADPRDCDAYPDSPFCGGNPIDTNFVSLEPIIIADGCNLGIRLEGTLGYIRMPPVNFVYRNPACRYPESDPPSEPGDGYTDFDVPIPSPGCGCFASIGFWTSSRSGVGKSYSGRMATHIRSGGNFTVTNSTFPSNVLDPFWTDVVGETSWSALKDNGELDENRTSYSQFGYSFRYTSSNLTNGRLRLYTTQESPWAVIETSCFPCAIPPEMPFAPPPSPLPPSPPPPMTCCPQDDSLLRAILAKVNLVVNVSNDIQAKVTLALNIVNILNQVVFRIEASITNEINLITQLQASITLQFNQLNANLHINAVLTAIANIQTNISAQLSVINQVRAELNSLTVEINNNINNTNNNNSNFDINLVLNRLDQIRTNITTIVSNRVDAQANLVINTITTRLNNLANLQPIITSIQQLRTYVTQMFNSLSLDSRFNIVNNNLLTLRTSLTSIATNITSINSSITNVSTKIDAQANIIISGVVSRINFQQVVDAITSLRDHIDDLLENLDFNIDVINQVNVDTEPLVQIVGTINNKIDLQSNLIVSNVLEGLDLQSIITSITNLRDHIDDLLENLDFNIDVINQVNVDTEPLVEIVGNINNKIDLQANVIVSNVLAGLDFDAIITLINNLRIHIDELLEDLDFNIDVINQVNVDSTPLAEIVGTINNKIDTQINTVISGILVGIGGIINLQPVLNAIANLKLELNPKFSYTENNIVNRLNTSFNFSPVINALAQIEFNINAKLNDCIENEYEFDLELALINLRRDVTNILSVVNAIRASNLEVDLSSVTNAINEVELHLTNTINTNANSSSLQYTLNQLQTLISNNSTTINTNLSALVLANQNNSQLISNVNTAILAVGGLLNPDITGELVGFNCETGEDINYAFTGRGLLGLKAELVALSQQLKQTTIDVCPEITGEIEYDHDCDEETENKIIPYTGRGLVGIKNLILGVSETIIDANKNICEIDSDGSCNVIFPGEQFAEFDVPTQLSLTFGENYPKAHGSKWHMNIPYPIDWQELDWCTHFEPMFRTLGHHQGRVYFKGNKMWVGGYAETQESIEEFLLKHIVPLSKLPVQKDSKGNPRVRTTTGGNVKRLPETNTIRCVRAAYVEIEPETHKYTTVRCFRPPKRGC